MRSPLARLMSTLCRVTELSHRYEFFLSLHNYYCQPHSRIDICLSLFRFTARLLRWRLDWMGPLVHQCDFVAQLHVRGSTDCSLVTLVPPWFDFCTLSLGLFGQWPRLHPSHLPHEQSRCKEHQLLLMQRCRFVLENRSLFSLLVRLFFSLMALSSIWLFTETDTRHSMITMQDSI